MKQSKEPNKTNLNKTNFRNKNAITLIALVVTIVVLLILAGVTISLLLDENGIIAKSKDARLENRASQIEDEIGMWKQNNFINKESGQAQEKADTILASLISRNILKEEEIDREQRIITIKKKDGSILKEINYSPVTINISKNPETTKSGAVLLTVESVEGMTMPSFRIYHNGLNEDFSEVINYIDTLSEEQKKEIIKNCYIQAINGYESANCTTFEEALKWMNKTEEEFWSEIKSEGELNDATLKVLQGPCYNRYITGRIEGYVITEIDEKLSEFKNEGEDNIKYYSDGVATENGTYTFKIKDIITGEIYTKKVEVTNIDKTKPAFAVISDYFYIYLWDTLEKKRTTFENAYIIYKDEKIDITAIMLDFGKTPEIRLCDVGRILMNKGLVDSKSELIDTNQTIILVKDGKEYTGIVNMRELPEPY